MLVEHVSGQDHKPPYYLGIFHEGPIDGRRYETLGELGEEKYCRYINGAATVLAFSSDYQEYELVRYAYAFKSLMAATQTFLTVLVGDCQ